MSLSPVRVCRDQQGCVVSLRRPAAWDFLCCTVSKSDAASRTRVTEHGCKK
jgi:hypothetical protein